MVRVVGVVALLFVEVEDGVEGDVMRGEEDDGGDEGPCMGRCRRVRQGPPLSHPRHRKHRPESEM